MSALTFGAFLEASGGKPLGQPPASGAAFDPSTDSRSLQAGQVFICLRGPSFDAHDYIGAAIARGAAALVIDDASKLPADSPPAILVASAKEAYLAGAAAARRLARARTVAITGSNGKTTTKVMCAQILSRRYAVLATPQNENNELGVAKLCYALNGSIDVAVFEFGARRPGDIALLVEIAAPDIGVLTNIGEAHMQYFADREELAATKFAIFSGGARAVCNAADRSTRVLAQAADIARDALWIRLWDDPQAPGMTLEAGRPHDSSVRLSFGSSHATVSWKLPGDHHLRDALSASAAALLAGMRFEEVAAAFGDLHLPPGRFEIRRLAGGVTLVYDAYNANPTSLAHALRAFAALPAQRRIAVLGSMAELGPQERVLHEQAGELAASAAVDLLFCGGDFAEYIAAGALRAGMRPPDVVVYRDNGEAAAELRGRMLPGDAVLLKGSRVQKLEEVLAALVGALTAR